MPIYINGRLQGGGGGGGGGGPTPGLNWQQPVLSRVSASPGAPIAGDRYIVDPVGSGDFAGHDNEIAEWNGSSWVFLAPVEGYAVWVLDEDRPYFYSGVAWQILENYLIVEELQTASTDTADRLRPNGAGGVEFAASGDITDSSTGADTTSGSSPLTKVSITLPAEDATFILRATALISHSTTSGNPAARLQNTSDAVTVGRQWSSEMKDADNILAVLFEQEIVQTVVGGAKTFALQYFVDAGGGTMTISDAYIAARRKVE